MELEDELLFAEEDHHDRASVPTRYWKLLVVDDDPEVHRISRLILQTYELDGRKLEILGAHTASEARAILTHHADIAVILLDVVMESEDAGLRLVRWIRDSQGNDMVRIILRTGQPGAAPEKSVIRDYRINDYKSKTELTDLKLYTAITVALRSWQDLRRLQRSEAGFRHLVEASGQLVSKRSRDKFYQGVLLQLSSLVNFDEDGLIIQSEGVALENDASGVRILAATGAYESLLLTGLDHESSRPVRDLMEAAIRKQRSFFHQRYFVAYFAGSNDCHNVIIFRMAREVSSLEQELMRVFASNVGHMFNTLDLSEHVEASQRDLLVTLGEVVESRSNETSNHVRRVGELASMLGKACGMGDQEAELIRVAAPMHDVGKMAIPDSILNKPGSLTHEELLVMRQHTILGANMLKGSSGILALASAIARAHHEHWDGSGYPLGLRGEEIPLSARITAICDVFDALYHTRVYKPAWPLDSILDYFRENQGTQFDPMVLDRFFEQIDQVVAIMNRWPE